MLRCVVLSHYYNIFAFEVNFEGHPDHDKI